MILGRRAASVDRSPGGKKLRRSSSAPSGLVMSSCPAALVTLLRNCVVTSNKHVSAPSLPRHGAEVVVATWSEHEGSFYQLWLQPPSPTQGAATAMPFGASLPDWGRQWLSTPPPEPLHLVLYVSGRKLVIPAEGPFQEPTPYFHEIALKWKQSPDFLLRAPASGKTAVYMHWLQARLRRPEHLGVVILSPGHAPFAQGCWAVTGGQPKAFLEYQEEGQNDMISNDVQVVVMTAVAARSFTPPSTRVVAALVVDHLTTQWPWYRRHGPGGSYHASWAASANVLLVANDAAKLRDVIRREEDRVAHQPCDPLDQLCGRRTRRAQRELELLTLLGSWYPCGPAEDLVGSTCSKDIFVQSISVPLNLHDALLFQRCQRAFYPEVLLGALEGSWDPSVVHNAHAWLEAREARRGLETYWFHRLLALEADSGPRRHLLQERLGASTYAALLDRAQACFDAAGHDPRSLDKYRGDIEDLEHTLGEYLTTFGPHSTEKHQLQQSLAHVVGQIEDIRNLLRRCPNQDVALEMRESGVSENSIPRLECGICMGEARGPVLCQPCLHGPYCAQCLLSWFHTRGCRLCPHCRDFQSDLRLLPSSVQYETSPLICRVISDLARESHQHVVVLVHDNPGTLAYAFRRAGLVTTWALDFDLAHWGDTLTTWQGLPPETSCMPHCLVVDIGCAATDLNLQVAGLLVTMAPFSSAVLEMVLRRTYRPGGAPELTVREYGYSHSSDGVDLGPIYMAAAVRRGELAASYLSSINQIPLLREV